MKSLVHVGSNDGREYKGTLRPTVLIEAWGDICLQAREMHAGNPNIAIGNFVVGSKRGKTVMWRSDNNAESSSVLKPKDHLAMFPNIKFERCMIAMPVVPLDEIVDDLDCDELVIDVQGYELEVLKGATETLKTVEKIRIEVNRGEVYEGCAQFDDVVDFLGEKGFKLDSVNWYKPEWGDAVFIK